MAKYILSDGDIFITPASGSSTTITGNVTITGTSTNLSSTDTAISDNIIILNDGESGAGVTLTYSGIQIDRGSSDDVLIRYNDSTDKWEMTNDGSSFGDIVSTVSPGSFMQNLVEDLTPELGGDLDVNGKSIITSNTNENIVLDPAGTGIVDVQSGITSTGDILPAADSTYDVGSSGTRWTAVYADTVDGTTLTGTLSTAAQTNITSLGTLTTLAVDNITIDLNTISSTSGALNITPFAGSAIVLDGTISIDAGVVTGATSITSTGFIGALTGNADTATSAGIVTTAAQTNITSLGTLTALQVDNININGNTIISSDVNGNIVFDPNGTGAVSVTGTSHMVPPIGSTAQRPGAPTGGEYRYNTTTGKLEFYNGDDMAWEAAGITISGQIFGDVFTGDGSTSVFVISAASDEENELFVTINGVVQTPVTAYTVATTNLTFTSPPANLDTIVVRNLTAAQSITKVIDTDGDTYIDVESGSDNDAIQFFTVGTERGSVDSAGVWTFNDATNVSGATPLIKLTETGVTANNTVWRIGVDSEQLVHQVANDAEDAATNYITVNRTLNVVDSINFTATTGLFSGTLSATAFSGPLTGNVTGNASGTAATVTGAAQTSITSVGILTALSISGDLTMTGATPNIATDTIGDTITISADAGVPNVTFSGAAASESATFHGSVIITDDLTVNGTTTTINTTNTVVTDALMEMGNGTTGTPTNDSGMVVERGDKTNMFWGIDGATDEFTVGTGSFTGASTGALTKTDAAVRFGALAATTGSFTGHVVPSANNTYNIGTATTAIWATVYATTFDGVSTSAQYADIAERYETDIEYTVGTVMVFGGDKEVTTSTTLNDHRVAGVISEAPALLMNDKAGPFETHPPIGLTGRVPCRVQGIIKKGDLMITSSIAGVAVAMGDTEFKPGAVLGKALEDYNSDDVGIIEVVLGLN